MIGRHWLPPPGAIVLVGLATLLAYDAARLDPAAGARDTPLPARVPQFQTASTNSSTPGIGLEEIHFDAIILERPLFTPTRRPHQPAPPMEPELEPEPEPELEPVRAEPPLAPPPPPAPPSVALRGTLVHGGTRRVLIVRNGDRTEWLDEGAVVDGWRLVEIGASHALLENSGVTHRLELYSSLR